jgi:CheY-like chemotaxis protein
MIVIVDDDETVRNATQSLVRALGYRASTFASADEFLKSEQVHDTSCLITDVQMPGLSGLDLQDQLIARGHRIPIIFITGYPDKNVRIFMARASTTDARKVSGGKFHLCHLTPLSFSGTVGRDGANMHEWVIVCLMRGGAHIIGYVWAEDEATAILSAVQQFGFVGQENSLEAHLVTPP